MQIAESAHGTWIVLRLNGRLDDAGSSSLKEKLLPLMTGGAVALDFTNVEYVTSVGFRVLMIAFKEQSAKHGKLLLGNMSDPVQHYFDVAGLTPLFKVVRRIEDIIAQR